MYLHIGNGKNIRRRDVIGIFDLDTSTVSSITKKFINKNEKEGRIEYSDADLPRSFILTEEKGEYRIKLSRISSSGLKARCENPDYHE
jgi:hypothetical protein